MEGERILITEWRSTDLSESPQRFGGITAEGNYTKFGIIQGPTAYSIKERLDRGENPLIIYSYSRGVVMVVLEDGNGREEQVPF